MATQSPDEHQPTFSIDEAAFRAWWSDFGGDEPATVATMCDHAAEAAEWMLAADHEWLRAVEDGAQLQVYALHGIDSGFILTVRHRSWPYGHHGLQLATMHIDNGVMRDEFNDADPVAFAQALVNMANNLVDLVATEVAQCVLTDGGLAVHHLAGALRPAVPCQCEGRGHWGNDPDHAWETWVDEVQSNSTRLGYWQWVANRREGDGARPFQPY